MECQTPECQPTIGRRVIKGVPYVWFFQGQERFYCSIECQMFDRFRLTRSNEDTVDRWLARLAPVWQERLEPMLIPVRLEEAL